MGIAEKDVKAVMDSVNELTDEPGGVLKQQVTVMFALTRGAI